MSIVSEFLQRVNLIRNETQQWANTKERVADTFMDLFELDIWFRKVPPGDPNAKKIYLADGTLVDSISSNGVTPTITENVVTSYSIDPQTKTEHWNLTMTGDTDFDFTNMFATDNSKVVTITLKGNYAFTLPTWLKPLEDNDYYDTFGGTLAVEIVINIKNGGVNPSGYYSLQMIDYAL